MKIVINSCYGGFHPSVKAQLRLLELGCPHMKALTPSDYSGGDHTELDKDLTHDLEFMNIATKDGKVVLEEHNREDRNCKILVQVVEELGDEANTKVSTLKIVEVPDEIEWEIDEYDGWESVEEKHRSWG